MHAITDAHIHFDKLPAAARAAAVDPSASYRAFVPGITPEGTCAALASLGADPRFTFGAALHPWYLGLAEPDDAWRDEMAALLSHPAVRAVGETGLDRARFHGDPPAAARAQRWLEAHLDVAADHGVPVVFHCVRMHGALLETLVRRRSDVARGMVHAFAGSTEVARSYRELDVVLGIGPLVTRPDARRLRQTVRSLPEGSYTFETDAPYMSPQGRAAGEGVPGDVLLVAATVAELRGTDITRELKTSADVFERLFGKT